MPISIDFTLSTDNGPVALMLFAQGALYWPEGQSLFITDPHFGKADSFRHAGIAIPTALLDHDLARLTTLLNESQAKSLVVLGDFFHTRHSQSDNALIILEGWRRQHANVEIILVLGNHDAHAGPPPKEFDIHVVDAPFVVGPFVCHHLPQPLASTDGYILAGHLHPYVNLHDRDGSRLRLASFIMTPHQAILPAFGGFTGGSAYAPSTNDRVFVIAQGEIVEVSATRQPRSSPLPR
jgi:DNA ligase-associated metallophosphoesterase